ncbi:YggS family pyridoxal phosphate-dependent enzyme [candidate division KSB1 bacterium]
MTTMSIAENISAVRGRIGRAAEKSGRRAEEITLVAVTKTHPPEIVDEAIRCGLTDIGENRVQEAEQKFPLVKESAVWHFIGHLQRNKVKNVLRFSSIIHSVDSVRLAAEIDRQTDRPVDIFVEVNVGDEESKYGIRPDETPGFLREIRRFGSLNCCGLMAIPPLQEDPEDVRPYFRKLAEIQREVNRQKIFDEPLTDLSMGMTDDFETAIEEGATVVRIGRALFGPRRPR